MPESKGIVCLYVCALLVLSACSNDHKVEAVDSSPEDYSYDEAGPYAVGNRTITLMNVVEGRALNVELWYPAAARGDRQFIQDFANGEGERDEILALLADVPEQCTRRETASSRAVEPTSSLETFPLVVFSHCHQCTRYSSFSLAERLASHGIAVAAPDHALNTLFDPGALIDGEFLATRARDVSAVLDELLISNSAALPESLQGRFDSARVAVAGHSYGAATTGKVLQDDARFIAGMVIAAPVESPVLPGVAVANIAEPLLFMVAREDNSITEFGNAFIRANFSAAPGPAWKVEVADAGHWSFSDIAGIVPEFNAGCGEGERQTAPGEAFTYIDNLLARDITAAYGMRFFAAHLLGDDQAAQELSVSTVPDVVDVEVK